MPRCTLFESKLMDYWCYFARVYFSSGNAKCTVKVNEISDIGKSAAICPSMPKHVVQAFSLLQGSPEAQVAVLSLLLSYVPPKVVCFSLVLDIMLNLYLFSEHMLEA